MINLKDTAALFGKSLNELADTMGYTRQGLYDIFVTGKCNPNLKRLRAALQLLSNESDRQMCEQIGNAKLDASRREEALKQIADRFGVILK